MGFRGSGVQISASRPLNTALWRCVTFPIPNGPPPQPSSDEGKRVSVDVAVDASVPAAIADHSRRLHRLAVATISHPGRGPPSLCGVDVIPQSTRVAFVITPLGGTSEWM